MMDISIESGLDTTLALNPAEVKAELSELGPDIGSELDKVDDGERVRV